MIDQAWRRELALWKTFWLLHVTGTTLLALMFVGTASMMQLILHTANGNIDNAIVVQWQLFAAPVMVLATITVIWSVFSLILVWKNAKNTSSTIWTFVGRVYVAVKLLNVFIYMFMLLYALMTMPLTLILTLL